MTKIKKVFTEKEASQLEAVENLLNYAHPADYLETMSKLCFQINKDGVDKEAIHAITSFFKLLVLSNEVDD